MSRTVVRIEDEVVEPRHKSPGDPAMITFNQQLRIARDLRTADIDHADDDRRARADQAEAKVRNARFAVRLNQLATIVASLRQTGV